MSKPDFQPIDKKLNKLIIVVSIVIPIVVAVLFAFKLEDFGIHVEPLSFLPPIYATINGLTALLLIAAVISIKNGKRKLHENLMTTAILCSVLFLIMYVAYHLTSNSTKFGDTNHDGIVDELEIAKVGIWRMVYFLVLISHIVLSIVVIPMVLFTYLYALAEKFDKHKKLAKITFPIWLYVAITGVVVFIMISPYYAK